MLQRVEASKVHELVEGQRLRCVSSHTGFCDVDVEFIRYDAAESVCDVRVVAVFALPPGVESDDFIELGDMLHVGPEKLRFLPEGYMDGLHLYEERELENGTA